MDLRDDGVAASGTFSIASGSMSIVRFTCDLYGDCGDVDQASDYELVGGSLVVSDLCGDRIEGTFALQFRDLVNGSVFQVRSGRINAPIQ